MITNVTPAAAVCLLDFWPVLHDMTVGSTRDTTRFHLYEALVTRLLQEYPGRDFHAHTRTHSQSHKHTKLLRKHKRNLALNDPIQNRNPEPKI